MTRPHHRRIRGTLAGLGLAATLAACAGTPDAPLETVPNFDVARYLGAWHQVATTPAWFQDDCKASTTATYSEAPKSEAEDGLIKVVNECLDADGDPIDAEARARFLEGPETPKLEVTLVSMLGGWLWAAAGDYWVIGLDADYRWAVIGQPSRKYAWVLGRTEELDTATLAEVRGILRRAGYDPCALNLTTPTLSGPLCKAGE